MGFRFAMLVLLAAAFALPAVAQDAEQGFHIRPHMNNITRDGATLIWETRQPGESVVEYGREGAFDQRATGAPDEHNIHRVRITGLEAETVHSYRVRAGNDVQESTFKTAPATDRPVTFIVVGDSRRWNASWESTRMAAHAAQWNPEFYINNGDLVVNGHQRDLWPEHFDRFHDLAQSLWMVTARGNHEGSMIFDVENDWFAKYHELPGDGEPYAVFDWGNTHFVLVSFEQTPGAPAFLDQHMPGADKQYTVLAQHYPVYCSGYYGPTDSRKEFGDRQMKPLADAIDRHDIDLDVAGHTHIYERMFGWREGKRDDRNGCMYIVNGGDINANFPEAFTAIRDDREAMEKPTYTVIHMGNDRIWFRTFAWGKAEQDIIEIDYCVRWRDEALPQAVLEQLPGATGADLLKAIEELGAMTYQPAGEALLPYLDDADPAVRRTAATALRRIGSAEIAPRLLPHLASEDAHIQREMARALEIASDVALAPAVADAAKNAALDVKARVALIGALQFHAPKELATATAIAVLRDTSTPALVRERASYALVRTAGEADIAAIIEMFDRETEEYVMLRLAFTLNELCGRRQPVDGKTPIGQSKPGERGEFIKKWVQEIEKDKGALPDDLKKWAA